MALADTAALISSLILQDKFSKTADKFNSTLTGMEQKTNTLGRIGNDVSRGVGTAVGNLTRIGVVGLGVLSTQVAAGIQSLIRLEEVTAATAAVITSTGGAAGVTAVQVRDLAEKFEGLNATMDDKVIQSGENLLLTFTNITEKAFEPALEAALNMNQAMGGGEEGLQSTIIQVGKALQDPIRGATALRRVGVQLSQQQEDQIKILVEQNDLYGAQQIILEELGREFGGQFAAAGDTAAGKFARFKDAVEDAQMSLATAFLPVLEKVADKLTTLLADPEVQAGIQDLGGELAEAFDAIVEIAGNLPWDSIRSAFEVMGTGSKALLTAFTSLPPWVQTAVLTGWGLNKLTGGALGSILGTVAQTLIKQVLGITAAQVNITAANVTGVGGVGGAAGGTVVAGGGARAAGANLLQGIGRATIFTAIAVAIGEAVAQNITRPANPEQFDFNAVAGASGQFSTQAQAEAFAQSLADKLDIPLEDVKAGIVTAVNSQGLTFDQAVDKLTSVDASLASLGSGLTALREGGEETGVAQALVSQQLIDLHKQQELNRVQAAQASKDTIARLREGESLDQKQTREITANLNAVRDAKAAAQAAAAAQLQAQAQANMKLQQIADKNFSPTVAVTVTSNVSISDVQRRITSQQIAIGRGPLEFE